jgi:hypothetical protein
MVTLLEIKCSVDPEACFEPLERADSRPNFEGMGSDSPVRLPIDLDETWHSEKKRGAEACLYTSQM